MPSRQENIFRTRSLLDDPYPQSPSLHRLVQQELSGEQDICNQLNNTGKAWSTATVDLVLSPNQDTYEINASNFGKPLYVVKATNNIYVPYISVPFDDITDLNYGQVWGGYNNIYGGLYTENSTPERMAFYRNGIIDATKMVKIQPMPQYSATYTISYLIGHIGTDDPLSSAFALPEHATLLQLRNAMALALGGYCQWYEDYVRNEQKAKMLVEGFKYQLSIKESIFKEYISSLSHSRMTITDDWNEV